MPVTKLNALRKAGKGFKDAPLVIRARIGIWTNYKQAACRVVLRVLCHVARSTNGKTDTHARAPTRAQPPLNSEV